MIVGGPMSRFLKPFLSLCLVFSQIFVTFAQVPMAQAGYSGEETPAVISDNFKKGIDEPVNPLMPKSYLGYLAEDIRQNIEGKTWENVNIRQLVKRVDETVELSKGGNSRTFLTENEHNVTIVALVGLAQEIKRIRYYAGNWPENNRLSPHVDVVTHHTDQAKTKVLKVINKMISDIMNSRVEINWVENTDGTLTASDKKPLTREQKIAKLISILDLAVIRFEIKTVQRLMDLALSKKALDQLKLSDIKLQLESLGQQPTTRRGNYVAQQIYSKLAMEGDQIVLTEFAQIILKHVKKEELKNYFQHIRKNWGSSKLKNAAVSFGAFGLWFSGLMYGYFANAESVEAILIGTTAAMTVATVMRLWDSVRQASSAAQKENVGAKTVSEKIEALAKGGLSENLAAQCRKILGQE